MVQSNNQSICLSQDKRVTTTEGMFALVAAQEALEDCAWKATSQQHKERAVSTWC